MENFCKIGKLEQKIGYDVCRGGEFRQLPSGEIRYDLTLLYATDKDGELPRTFGHYHTKGFAELFEVLEGQTMVLMQKYEQGPNEISEVYLIGATTDEAFIVLPDFGFTNINPDTTNDLLLSNWVDIKIENQYDFIKKYDGFCYRPTRDENGKIEFGKNENYKDTPELIKLKPKKLPEELKDLDFLIHPSKYGEFLTIESLYERT